MHLKKTMKKKYSEDWLQSIEIENDSTVL